LHFFPLPSSSLSLLLFGSLFLHYFLPFSDFPSIYFLLCASL
jgi:hypothetical protein